MFRLNKIRKYQFSSTLNIFRSSSSHIGRVTPQTFAEKDTLGLESENILKQSYLHRLIQAYRDTGFQYDSTNPLQNWNRSLRIDISPDEINILPSDVFSLEGLFEMGETSKATFEEILAYLRKTYSENLTFETSHVKNIEEKEWFYKMAETKCNYSLDRETKLNICHHLMKSQVLEDFLGKKFPTLKRYSGEGAESMLAFFHQLFLCGTQEKVEDILISIPHRGRIALLTVMLGYQPSQLFHKIKGNTEFSPKYRFTGDVVSHLTTSTNMHFNDSDLHLSMIPNPSHLEASHPVIAGKTRGRQLSKSYGYYGDKSKTNSVMNVQIHGDAAISGQGIVTETLALASLPNFDVGGTIHLIVNNQLGFTTAAMNGRTSSHCSDVGKLTDCPIIHVNGDHPEEVAMAAKIAFAYKCKFQKDILVNMHCFRRWGHNEVDDPTFTNPSIYKVINERQSVSDLYKTKLIEDGTLSSDDAASIQAEYFKYLNEELKSSEQFHEVWSPFNGNWRNIQQADRKTISVWNTGCNIDTLKAVGIKSATVPETFSLHPHLRKTFVQSRQSKMEDGLKIDWSTAEALAVGSLLLEGSHVRICGQDVGRGTFSHRHVMLIDQETEESYIPLNYMAEHQNGRLEVVNSPLSEEAVLAFEYGMSIENPKHLCIWEAQFGDFFNGAQIIIDTFITNGELKWLIQSGLVILLPHGMDGAGPDHSSCKIERFLQLSDSLEDRVDGDDVNIQVVNPTTPAQYFHVLRRQQVRNFRKPLIVASPKLILRLPAATSSLDEMRDGTYFKPVLTDEKATPSKVKKLLFCSGKYYYELDKQREKLKKDNIAIVRLEALVPFPAEELKEVLAKYGNCRQFIWCQEEHRNQGAWSFVHPRFENLLNVKLSYQGRDVLGASSVGVGKWHAREEELLIQQLFTNDEH